MFALQMKAGIWLASKHLNFNLKCFCFNVLMSGINLIWFASKYLKSGLQWDLLQIEASI
jgi:hypothetical protein